jgi:hypothetical protein
VGPVKNPLGKNGLPSVVFLNHRRIPPD